MLERSCNSRAEAIYHAETFPTLICVGNHLPCRSFTFNRDNVRVVSCDRDLTLRHLVDINLVRGQPADDIKYDHGYGEIGLEVVN